MTGRGASGQPGAARSPAVAARAEMLARIRSGTTGSDDHRTLAEVLHHGCARLVRVVHPAEDDHHPVALDGAQRVQPDVPGRAPYVVDDRLAGGRVRRRDPAEHDHHVAGGLPAERAGPGEHRLVGLGAQHARPRPGPRAGRPTRRGISAARA